MSPIIPGIYASQITGHLVTSNFFSIATVTTSGTASVTFSSIPQTYKSLHIRLMASAGAGSNAQTQVQYNFNSDATATNYWWHALRGNSSSAVTNAGNANILFYGADTPTTTSIYGVGIIDIIDYSSTTKYKTSRSMSGHDFNGSGNTGLIYLGSSLWNNTSAISSITLTASDGNWTTGSTFSLYGVL